MDADVLIAGGGPVGMTLALELAHHGVRSIVAERNATTTRHPKMDLTNGRSMEFYRRLGIADSLRAVGVPPDQPLDIVWATSAAGHVLHRFAYHAPTGGRDLARVRNDGSHTLEPPMRVSQIVLEPVLKAAIDASPLVDVRFGWAFVEFAQDTGGVVSILRNGATGETVKVHSNYLAGCDGGGSKVRQGAAIAMAGEHGVGDAFMVHFRSTDHAALARFGVAYHLQTARGTVIAQNGRDVWTLQAMAPPDSDPDQLLRDFAGRDFGYEILVANPWQPHMVLAERFRAGRVLIAGDAAHQVIPTGGYGMNTGVGDAVDLGWKLAAVINGWGGDALLDSYEHERRAVGARNRAMAGQHAAVRFAIAEAILAAEAQGDLDAPGSAAARMALGARIATLGNAENECWGIEHGYSYAGSPVVADEGDGFVFDPLRCQASAAPGNRLPSLYLADGRPLFDLLGPEFTLLAVGDAATGDAAGIAARRGLPLRLVRLDAEAILDRLGATLLLIRPDQHVAWRGDATPVWSGLFDQATGSSPALARNAA